MTSLQFRPGKVFDNWEIADKLDEGGFGQYIVMGRKDKKLRAVLKAEWNSVDGNSAFIWELRCTKTATRTQRLYVLQALQEGGAKPHIPFLFHAAKHTPYVYMITTLLGPNLQCLKSAQKGEKLSTSTWIRISIQCLYALKVLHDYGFLHGNITPGCFAMGEKSDRERARCVFLLNFGLSRNYAFKLKSKWYCYKGRSSGEFRGSIRYCSPTVHDNIEQGRRDDIWSLFFVLIELRLGVPWMMAEEDAAVVLMKQCVPDHAVMHNLPRELRSVIPDLRKLEYYSRPDYMNIYKKMVAVMKRKNIENEDPYDWEEAGKILNPSKPPEWHDAESFFASDPVMFEAAPTREERKTRRDRLRRKVDEYEKKK